MHGDVERKKYQKNAAIGTEIVGFYSGWDDDGESVLTMAPHAGSMELNTGKQAERMHDIVAFQGVTTWIFKGGKGNQSAFDTWHVGSTEISGDKPQFDLLQKYVEHRNFHQGVSFHGYSKDGILIGGQHGENWKDMIASSLRKELPVNIPIQIATTPGKYAGMSDSNILNKLADTCIQLEQSMHVRKHYWKEVAEVIGGIYSSSH